MVKKITNPIQYLHPKAKTPSRSTDGAAAYDFSCVCGIEGMPPQQLTKLREKAPESVAEWEVSAKTGCYVLQPNAGMLIRLGIAMTIEPGHCCCFWDRSGMAGIQNIHRFAGLIDEDYLHWEWLVKLFNHHKYPVTIQEGQRVVQGLFQERIEVDFDDKLPLTHYLPAEVEKPRDGGFESTGA